MAGLMWVSEKAGGPEIFHLISGIVSCVVGAWSPTMLHTRCVCVCVSGGRCVCVWTEPHGGFQWMGCRVDCEGWWEWLLWTMPLPLFHSLILRQAHCKESPRAFSTQLFPMGNMTLTVAHVCHITHRFRRKTKNIVWMMNDGAGRLIIRHFILLWCINCLEHIDSHTPALAPALPQVLTHTHRPTLNQGCEKKWTTFSQHHLSLWLVHKWE